jgi:hypothetical protein
MNTCPACETAKTRPHSGGIYMLGCQACEVRKVAADPKLRRELAYAAIKDPAIREAFAAEVEAAAGRQR